MKRLILSCFLLLLFSLPVQAKSGAAPDSISIEDLIVINTEDAGRGSLRYAITCAEFLPAPRRITFNLTGTPPFVIAVASDLALLASETIIDGTTQPGYSPGHIILDGLNVANDFSIFADSCEVYGLHFRNFVLAGLGLCAEKCIIGAVGKGNIFTENEGYGLMLARDGSCSNGHTVAGNYIGTLPASSDRFVDRGNILGGILVDGTSHVIRDNVIAFNQGSGIFAEGQAFANRWRNNRIFCNPGGGIVFVGTNINVPPQIVNASNIAITGTGNPGDTIDLYINDPEGCQFAPCQGKTPLGFAVVSTDERWEINGSIAFVGRELTATATDQVGNTSVFSDCIIVGGSTAITEVILPPEAFTPDGDGVNDTWIIKDIEQFPDNELIILNRWGNQVFYSRSYQNNWAGTTSGGSPLMAGTYFYILIINDDGRREVIRGGITLFR